MMPAAQAAVELKRVLEGAGEDMSAAARKQDRQWFIETYYLERQNVRTEAQRPHV